MSVPERPAAGIEIDNVQPATQAGTVLGTFSVRLGGVTIHGCRLVDGKRGRFIGWPSRRKPDTDTWHPVVEVSDSLNQRVLAEVEPIFNVTRPAAEAPYDVPF